ncbi:BolA family protein [Arenimonas daejeonensis]|uniref:BolA family protein n=1 Tax=Arenimonas daejeonensis TaxID=370777 RepID=UPI0011BDF2FF|nr:BolA/IbaG family iron-sulfur metabolism protein [Arenimonas daejeonensis]
MTPEFIQELIETGLPGAQARVQGEDGVHFEATVVCEAFRGKLPLARHRLVYATLGERMGGEIHALALRTLTPKKPNAPRKARERKPWQRLSSPAANR